jgi:hypothetical protein
MRIEDIRRQLGVVNIAQQIEDNNNRWKGYVIRTSPRRYPRQALFYNPDGKRDLGSSGNRRRYLII